MGILSGSIIDLLSICGFIILVLNRIKDFRISTQLAKNSHIAQNGEIDELRNNAKKIGEITHWLFNVSLILFIIGESLIIIGFIIQTSDKF